MIPRIKSVKPVGQFFLEVVFDDGKKCIYNVEEDINQIKSYENLRHSRIISAGQTGYEPNLCLLE